jgi:AcrR family transcriptional regulator
MPLTHKGGPLTHKGGQTRSRIVAGAAAEVRERGIDDVRLEDVMARTGTSKGQLFHYFPDGKEELLLAVAQHEADQVLADQEPMLSDLSTWAAWDAWRDRLISRYRDQGPACPLAGVLAQMNRRAPAAQAVVTVFMEQWQRSIADGIRRMQSTGDISPELDADRTAGAVLAGIQGGVVVLLNTGRIDNLEAVLDLMLSHLRSPSHQ